MSASEETAGVSTLPLLLLPQDILVEILSKLPAKSLLRLRCVSKFFCALIADHGFGVLHRSLSLTLPSRAGILIAIIPQASHSSPPAPAPAYYTINFSEENPRRPRMLQANRLGYLDSEPFLKGCRLLSSSDGLICLTCRSRSKGDVVVCNISTGQRISLPTIQFPSNYPYPYLTCALLGFDSQSKRYKVLMSAYMIDRGSRPVCFKYCKNWVLTVGVDKSWREINHSSHPFDGLGCHRYFGSSLHIDGVIYSYNWMSRDGDPPSFHIVAFEVGSESYSLIPIPTDVLSSSEIHSIDGYPYSDFILRNFALVQVDGGRLAIVHVRKILCYIDVWTWEKSKGCWEKITRIIPSGLRIEQSLKYPRYTTNHAGEIVLLCENSKHLSIWVCNLKSEVWKKFDVGGVKEFPISVLTDVIMYRTMDNVFSLE